jgi:hypothetical protein
MQESTEFRISELTKNKEGWVILDINSIDKAIREVESQEQSYTCGPITLAHCALASKLDINKKFIEECPLSVEATVEKLQSNMFVWNVVSNFITQQIKQEGALRVGPAPEQMEGYFNKYFQDSPNQLVYVGEKELRQVWLESLLTNSLNVGLPAIILIQYDMLALHYLMVVGINEETHEIIVMDTVKNNNQLRKENINEILAKMNVSQTVNFVKILDGLAPQLKLFGINLDMILSQRASSSIVQNWENYNILIVRPADQVKEAILNRERQNNSKNNQGCAQQ